MVTPQAWYEIVGELVRFSQRNSAFARARWDPTSAAYGKRGPDMEDVLQAGKPGFSREDFALHAGAWAVSRMIGKTQAVEAESAHVAVDERVAALPYEPEDLTSLTEGLKRAARFYGASLVGVTRVNPLWVYACDGEEEPIELPDGVNTAVVMAIEMDYEMIQTAPSLKASAATGNGYSRMAFVTACVARYLSVLGWRSLPCGNDTALSVPLAVDAGLGEPGRHGMLITQEFGPRVRLCKVFTDAPLLPDRPVSFGAAKVCERCRKCVEACPVDAITDGPRTTCALTPSNNPGVLKWYVDADRCLAFWRDIGTSCTRCISSCVFNRPRKT